jgi:hypothetical protein
MPSLYRALVACVVLLALAAPAAAQSLPNDDIAGAKSIKVGKATRTPNAHLATTEAGEDGLACGMFNTVWYRFTVPISGFYTFSTAGSSLYTSTGIFAPDTVMAVYELNGSVPAIANLTERACVPGYVGFDTAGLTHFPLTAGDTIMVRVGTDYAGTVGAPSSYRLKVTLVASFTLFTDGGFESSVLGEHWVLKKGGPMDGIVPIDPNGGTKHFQFAGVPAGKKATLKQTWTVPGTLKLPKDTIVAVEFTAKLFGEPNTNAKLIVGYKDGTSNTVFTVTLDKAGPSYHLYGVGVATTSGKVAGVTLKIKDKTTSGSVYLDGVTVYLLSDFTRGVPAALPLPEAQQ